MLGCNQHHQIYVLVSDNNEGYKSDIDEFERVKPIMDTQIKFSDFVNREDYLQT